MPAIANISISDGALTPLAHVFAPVSTDGSKGKLANRAATIPQGYETLTIEVREPTSPTAAYRIIGKMVLPTVGTVEGADAVVRSNTINFDFNFSQSSTVQDRENATKLMASLFGHATFVTVVENLEPLY